MKRFLVLLVILFATYESANSQWSYVGTIQGSPYINSISVVNPNVLWVVCDTGKVFRSTNGGVNWVQRNTGLPSGNLYAVSALDTSNCWVGNVSGSIYRTSDGGASWVLQFSIANSFSNGIKMFNANYGIYIGDPTAATGQTYQYRYTTNGGTNWLICPNLPIVNSEYGNPNGWDWLDTTNVFIGAATVVSGATSSKVYRTNVGFAGGVWNFGQFGGSGTSDGLYAQAVGFTDVNNGMIGANTSLIRKTTNGGATWSAVNVPPGLTSFQTENANALKDGSNTIRFMIQANLSVMYCYKTTDYGNSWINEPLPNEIVSIRIKQIQFLNPALGFGVGQSGKVMKYTGPSGINLVNTVVPVKYNLEQNYPNPFNPSTRINFSIPNSTNVTLKVYNSLGKEIALLVNEFKTAGNYSYDFNASPDLTSGIYFYTLSTDNFVQTKKLTLIK